MENLLHIQRTNVLFLEASNIRELYCLPVSIKLLFGVSFKIKSMSNKGNGRNNFITNIFYSMSKQLTQLYYISIQKYKTVHKLGVKLIYLLTYSKRSLHNCANRCRNPTRVNQEHQRSTSSIYCTLMTPNTKMNL